MKASRAVHEIAMCENTIATRMTLEVADDLHCSCQRATQTSRLRQSQAGSGIFCPEDEFDVSQAFTSSTESLPRVNSQHNQLQNTVCKCYLPLCQRTLNSTSLASSACPPRSMLRMNSSSRTKCHVSSILLNQLRLVSFLTLLSVSLFHQVDVAAARAMGNPREPEHGQDGDTTLPVRCTLPFSHYDCGSIASVRYTYLNGTCQRTLEWIGGEGCEYDGTENSFASEQECADVCIPSDSPTTTTAAPPSEMPMRYPSLPGIPTPSSVSQSGGSTDADIATGSSSDDEAPTVDTTICFLPIDENCQMITFPTSYFYYDLASLSCVSRVVFCPISGPNIFYSLEDCLNSCEQPLTPTTTATTEIPTTTTVEDPPTTVSTTDCPPPTTLTETTTEVPLTTTAEEAPPTTHTSPPPPETTTSGESVKTTNSPDVGSSGDSRPSSGPSFIELNKFDLASVGLGMTAFLLIVILVGVVLLSLYRRNARLRRQKREVMDSKKSEVPVRTLAFTANRHEKPAAAVQTKHCSNTSTSTTSSTISSYLTTV